MMCVTLEIFMLKQSYIADIFPVWLDKPISNSHNFEQKTIEIVKLF